MKKLVGFCIFVVILVGIFLIFLLKSKDYDVEYSSNGYDIYEKFVKDEGTYYFKISKDDYKYDFVVEHNYSNKRKIVHKINEQEKDDYKCISINVFNYDTPLICNNIQEYQDAYSLKISDNDSKDPIRTINKISIYNEDYDYYIWNGYGVTDIKNDKKYNFLKKESYDNNLSYQMENYLLIADYDSSREFSKFYIFNYEDKSINEWEFDSKISFNSYFMGDYDNYIYLFDKKNKVQYKLDIIKQTMSVSSDSEAAVYYNDKLDLIGINKLVYNSIYFVKTDIVNYSINDDKLYFNYKLSNKNILFDEENISGYVAIQDKDAFYLKKDTLYKYNIDTGKTKLLSYFEWNFSYNNKIFIFN